MSLCLGRARRAVHPLPTMCSPVCLPDFCLTTASVHPDSILAFWFTISLTLSLSICPSICRTVCLLVPAVCSLLLGSLPISVTAQSPTVSVTPWGATPAPLSSPAPASFTSTHPVRVSGSHHHDPTQHRVPARHHQPDQLWHWGSPPPSSTSAQTTPGQSGRAGSQLHLNRVCRRPWGPRWPAGDGKWCAGAHSGPAGCGDC